MNLPSSAADGYKPAEIMRPMCRYTTFIPVLEEETFSRSAKPTLCLLLSVCCLFNDDVISSENVASNNTVINGNLIGKDMEEIVHALMFDTIPVFSYRDHGSSTTVRVTEFTIFWLFFINKFNLSSSIRI